MSDQRCKVLSFGAFELSIGNRLLTNGSKVAPLGARAMELPIVLVLGSASLRGDKAQGLRA